MEAQVTLKAKPEVYQFLKQYESDLTTLLIVSRVDLETSSAASSDIVPRVQKIDVPKCERCWNYREAVGVDKEHPTLCDRCLEAISNE